MYESRISFLQVRKKKGGGKEFRPGERRKGETGDFGLVILTLFPFEILSMKRGGKKKGEEEGDFRRGGEGEEGEDLKNLFHLSALVARNAPKIGRKKGEEKREVTQIQGEEGGERKVRRNCFVSPSLLFFNSSQ